MTEHTNNIDGILRRSLTDALGPELLRDAEIERLLEEEKIVAADAEQMNRILDGARALVDRSSSHIVSRRWTEPLQGTQSTATSDVTMKRISAVTRDSPDIIVRR
ncbi:MAG: hypothetical protein P8J37_20655 [Fuerstiella sp.]|nr:hypothetical protein [Fuerstiella sp.]